MRSAGIASLLLLFGVSSAYADLLLSVDNTATTIHYSQQAGRPCIFADNSCHVFANRTLITVGGSTAVVDASTVSGGTAGNPVLYSTAVSTLTGLGSTTFLIGVDVNENDDTAINILQFDIVDTTTNTRLAHLNLNTGLNAFANGTGSSDALLGTLDLSGIAGGDGIQFRLRYDGASDGPEQFFLIPTSTIPEPGSVILFGTVVLGMAAFCRRRLLSR